MPPRSPGVHVSDWNSHAKLVSRMVGLLMTCKLRHPRIQLHLDGTRDIQQCYQSWASWSCVCCGSCKCSGIKGLLVNLLQISHIHHFTACKSKGMYSNLNTLNHVVSSSYPYLLMPENLSKMKALQRSKTD